MEARRIASPAVKALMGRRTAELTGLLLGLVGLIVLIALASYDARDPSLNTATTRHANNLAGTGGAVMADILLQGFGIAGLLPGIALLTWAWRIASHRGLGSVALRLVALLAALPVLAGVLAALPAPHNLSWPGLAGLGGAVGRLVATAGIDAAQDLLGPAGIVSVWIVGTGLAVILTVLALGLSAGEWRSAGSLASRAAQASVSGGRDAASAMARGASNLGGGMPRLSRFLPAGDRETQPEETPPTESRFRREPEVSPPRLTAPKDEPRPTATVRQTKPPRDRQPQQQSLPLPEAGWKFPPLDLLKPAPERAQSGNYKKGYKK